MTKCPSCRSRDVHRSHARTSLEKLCRYLFFRRYYRCHSCEWRGSVSALTLQSVLGVAAKRKAMILAVLAAILALILLEAYLLNRTGEYQPAEPPASRLGVTGAGSHGVPS